MDEYLADLDGAARSSPNRCNVEAILFEEDMGHAAFSRGLPLAGWNTKKTAKRNTLRRAIVAAIAGEGGETPDGGIDLKQGLAHSHLPDN